MWWWLGAQTPQSIWQRIKKDGAKGLRQALGSWKPWIPPKQGQVRPAPSWCTAGARRDRSQAAIQGACKHGAAVERFSTPCCNRQ